MNIKTINFPPIMKDNDTQYFNFMEAILNSVDELCTAEATSKINGVGVRVTPSHPQYNKNILKAIKDAHYFLGLRVEFSKSMKTSMTIEYLITPEK